MKEQGGVSSEFTEKPYTIYLTIFSLATSIFYFEIFSTVQIGFVVTQAFCMLAIGIAVLGQSLATSLLSIPRIQKWVLTKKNILRALPLLLAFSILLSVWISCLIKSSTNDVLSPLIGKGREKIYSEYYKALLGSTPWMGLVLLFPHFIFGFVNTSLFLCLPKEKYHRAYFCDLAGGAVGCVLGFAGLEYLPYLWNIGILVGGTALICRILARGKIANLWLLPGVMLPLIVCFLGNSNLEPRPQTDLLARNYEGKQETREVWSGWTSYTHSSIVKKNYIKTGKFNYEFSHGNGESNGTIQPYIPSNGPKHWSLRGESLQSNLVNSIGTPKTALVLFSGLGVDMLGIDAINKGETEITGVELNPKLLNGANQVLSEYDLPQFFSLDRIHMKWTEARLFLEGDPNTYDRILISWNGATWAYYTGVNGPTTQTIFSEEAFKTLFKHLNPNGMLVVLNMTKINLLHGIRLIFEQWGRTDPSRSVIILYDPEAPGSQTTLNWDQDQLLVKPDGFTELDIKNIENNVRSMNLKIAIAPGHSVAQGYEQHAAMLSTTDLKSFVSKLEKSSGKRMTMTTDDRPFAYDRFLNSDFFTAEFWRPVLFSKGLKRSVRQYALFFIFIFATCAIPLIFVPVFLQRSCWTRSDVVHHLHYFAVTGFGFMCIEVGLLQKMSLLLGNPGLSISIVLAQFIFFCGLGSIASGSEKGTGRLGLRPLVVAFSTWCVLFLASEKQVIAWAIRQPMVLRILVVLVLLAPGGFVIGHFFPRGLKRAAKDNSSFVPWAWTINGSLGVIAAALAPLLAQSVGFRNVLVVGCSFYLTLLFNRRHFI